MNRVPIACLHYQIMINFYEGSLAFIIISIHGLSGQDSTIFHPMKVYTDSIYTVYIPFVQNTYTQRYDYVLQLLSKREYRIFLIMLEGLRGGGI